MCQSPERGHLARKQRARRSRSQEKMNKSRGLNWHAGANVPWPDAGGILDVGVLGAWFYYRRGGAWYFFPSGGEGRSLPVCIVWGRQ